jgi:hypothetical protein
MDYVCQFAQTKVPIVDVQDTQMMEQIMFGVNPAVVQCINKTIGVHPMTIELAQQLRHIGANISGMPSTLWHPCLK